MSRNQILLIIIGGALVLFGIPLTLYLVSQQQDPRSRASEVEFPDVEFSTVPEPTTPASVQQTCEAPVAPENTDIKFPYNDPVNGIDLTMAGCTWGSVADATSYNVTITEVDTESVIQSDSVPSTTTSITFPIQDGNTYLCEVAAVSACGAVSSTSSDQQICETQAFISPSPTQPVVTEPPTVPPTIPPTVPVKQVTPPPTGSTETLLIGGGIAAVILAIGTAFLLW